MRDSNVSAPDEIEAVTAAMSTLDDKKILLNERVERFKLVLDGIRATLDFVKDVSIYIIHSLL